MPQVEAQTAKVMGVTEMIKEAKIKHERELAILICTDLQRGIFVF